MKSIIFSAAISLLTISAAGCKSRDYNESSPERTGVVTEDGVVLYQSVTAKHATGKVIQCWYSKDGDKTDLVTTNYIYRSDILNELKGMLTGDEEVKQRLTMDFMTSDENSVLDVLEGKSAKQFKAILEGAKKKTTTDLPCPKSPTETMLSKYPNEKKFEMSVFETKRVFIERATIALKKRCDMEYYECKAAGTKRVHTDHTIVYVLGTRPKK